MNDQGKDMYSFTTTNRNPFRGEWEASDWSDCENMCGRSLLTRTTWCGTGFAPECSLEGRPEVEAMQRCYSWAERKKVTYCTLCGVSGCEECEMGFKWSEAKGKCVNTAHPFAKVTLSLMSKGESELDDLQAKVIASMQQNEKLAEGVRVFPIDAFFNPTLVARRRLQSNAATLEVGFMFTLSSDERREVLSVGEALGSLSGEFAVRSSGQDLYDADLSPTPWPKAKPEPTPGPSPTPSPPGPRPPSPDGPSDEPSAPDSGSSSSLWIALLALLVIAGIGFFILNPRQTAPAPLQGGVN